MLENKSKNWITRPNVRLTLAKATQDDELGKPSSKNAKQYKPFGGKYDLLSAL